MWLTVHNCLHGLCPDEDDRYNMVVRHDIEKDITFAGNHEVRNWDYVAFLPPGTACDGTSVLTLP